FSRDWSSDVCSSDLRITRNGPRRHAQDDILCIFSLTVSALARTAALCEMMPVVSQIEQRVQVRIAEQDDRTPVAAVASGRSALRLVFLTSEGHRAGSAPAAPHGDGNVVDELHASGGIRPGTPIFNAISRRVAADSCKRMVPILR